MLLSELAKIPRAKYLGRTTWSNPLASDPISRRCWNAEPSGPPDHDAAAAPAPRVAPERCRALCCATSNLLIPVRCSQQSGFVQPSGRTAFRSAPLLNIRGEAEQALGQEQAHQRNDDD